MRKRVRRAQTITPFGVGAIMDIMGESLVAADITFWKGNGERIHEPRLEKLLRVNEFRMAPAESEYGQAQTVPYYRFPRWLFCPECRRMIKWTPNDEAATEGEPPRCGRCESQPTLVPMRFVMACAHGHLSDIPWEQWAHSLSGKKCEAPLLEFRSAAGGGGLEYLSVVCTVCQSSRSLDGIADPNAFQSVPIFCRGRQPWQWLPQPPRCNAVPQALQRGATNLTFPLTESSIDIPPFALWAAFSDENRAVTNTPEFQVIRSSPSNPLVPGLIRKVALDLKMKAEDVRRIVDQELREGGSTTTLADTDTNTESGGAGPGAREARVNAVLQPEFRAFLAPDTVSHPRDRFIKRRVNLQPYLAGLQDNSFGQAALEIADLLDTLVQVTRLREVRVLTGFSRLEPTVFDPSEPDRPGRYNVYGGEPISPVLVPADLGGLPASGRWLPAAEVYGEGIFFSLNEARLARWETAPSVEERARRLAGRLGVAGSYLPTPSARLLLLHTLAHVLVRQLSFECGYSIASLRERIYASAPDAAEPMAGILIYTAAGDAEGTLGGLVREGDPDRFLATFAKALQSADWCSSDPLCRESTGQGPEALNLAACHACALLPETSCMYSNRLLDRVVLLGSLEEPGLGLFAPVMQQLYAAMRSS